MKSLFDSTFKLPRAPKIQQWWTGEVSLKFHFCSFLYLTGISAITVNVRDNTRLCAIAPSMPYAWMRSLCVIALACLDLPSVRWMALPWCEKFLLRSEKNKILLSPDLVFAPNPISVPQNPTKTTQTSLESSKWLVQIECLHEKWVVISHCVHCQIQSCVWHIFVCATSEMTFL